MFLDDELYQIAIEKPQTYKETKVAIVAMINACKSRIDSTYEFLEDLRTDLRRINNSWNLTYDKIVKEKGECWFKKDGFKIDTMSHVEDRELVTEHIWN